MSTIDRKKAVKARAINMPHGCDDTAQNVLRNGMYYSLGSAFILTFITLLEFNSVNESIAKNLLVLDLISYASTVTFLSTSILNGILNDLPKRMK